MTAQKTLQLFSCVLFLVLLPLGIAELGKGEYSLALIHIALSLAFLRMGMELILTAKARAALGLGDAGVKQLSTILLVLCVLAAIPGIWMQIFR